MSKDTNAGGVVWVEDREQEVSVALSVPAPVHMEQLVAVEAIDNEGVATLA